MTHLIKTSIFNTAVCTTIYTTNRRINIMQPSQKRKEWFAILGRLTIFSVGIQYYYLGWRHIQKRSYFKINIMMCGTMALWKRRSTMPTPQQTSRFGFLGCVFQILGNHLGGYHGFSHAKNMGGSQKMV